MALEDTQTALETTAKGYPIPAQPRAQRPVEPVMARSLRRAGVTPMRLASKISEGMDAKRSLVHVVDKDIVITEVEDNATQFKHTKLALELMGAFPETKKDKNDDQEMTYEQRLRRLGLLPGGNVQINGPVQINMDNGSGR